MGAETVRPAWPTGTGAGGPIRQAARTGASTNYPHALRAQDDTRSASFLSSIAIESTMVRVGRHFPCGEFL